MIATKKMGLALSALTTTLLMSACGGSSEATTQQAAELPKVKIETVHTRTVDQTYDFTATVEACVTNNIAPAMSVRINRIFVEVGDQVQPGQRLAEMDQTNLLQQKTQLENYRAEFNRVDELYKVGGASKSEWDGRKTALDVAQAAYNNLMSNTVLASPIRGVVTARNYDGGDMYSPGSQPVLVVEQITPVEVVLNVSESLFEQVKKGMPVDLTLDVYGTEVFKGKVSLVYPTIDPQTRTFPVEVVIPNADRRVRPGMFARVTMNFGTLTRVVAPDRSIIKQAGSGERFAYTYKDGKVSYVRVELGRRMGEEYEVLSGVSDGDQVVVTGQSRLNNGTAVEIDKAQ